MTEQEFIQQYVAPLGAMIEESVDKYHHTKEETIGVCIARAKDSWTILQQQLSEQQVAECITQINLNVNGNGQTKKYTLYVDFDNEQIRMDDKGWFAKTGQCEMDCICGCVTPLCPRMGKDVPCMCKIVDAFGFKYRGNVMRKVEDRDIDDFRYKKE